MAESTKLVNVHTGETLTTYAPSFARTLVASGDWQRWDVNTEIAGAMNATLETDPYTAENAALAERLSKEKAAEPAPDATSAAPVAPAPVDPAPTVETPQNGPKTPEETSADFTQIPGVDVEIAGAMHAAGILTWQDAASATQRKLRALAGIGSTRAKTIQTYAQTKL